MAGEDVVIRVGVDYSAAIAQTRQFEQELRRILTSAAQVQIGAGSRSQAVGAGGPDLGRELKGINTSLQSLLAVTRQNSQSTPVLAELKGINTSLQSILSVSRQNARGMDASRELRGVTTALQTLVTQTRVSGRGTQSTTSGFDSSRELNRVGNTLQSILALSRQNQGTGNRDSGITELRSIDTSLRSILAISRQGQGNTTTSSGSSQELNQVNKTLQSLVVGSRPGVTVDNSSEFGKLNNSLQTLVAVTRQNTQANRTVVFVEREHRVPATAIAPSPPPTPSAPVEPVRVRVPEPINPLSSRGAFTESRASRELAATQNAYANALRNEIRRFSQPQIAPVSRELPRPAQPAPRPAQAPLGLPRPVQTPPSQMPLADFLAAQRVLTQPRSVVQAAELGVETGPVTRPVRRRYISPDLTEFKQQHSIQERVQSLASRSREYRSALPRIDQTLAPQNFAGMERQYVEQIRLTMKRLFSWFPEVAKDLAFVGTPAGAVDSPLSLQTREDIAYGSGRISSTTAAVNVPPVYGSEGGVILFNPSGVGSFTDFAKQLPREFAGGRFAGNLGVSSLAVHEFGHSLDRVRGGGGTLDALSKRNNTGNDRLLAQGALEISSYASTKVTELYAEAFSQSLSDFPSELGRRIYQEMAGHRAGDPGRRAGVLASETNKFSGLTGIQSGWSDVIDLRQEALNRILSPSAQAILGRNVQPLALPPGSVQDPRIAGRGQGGFISLQGMRDGVAQARAAISDALKGFVGFFRGGRSGNADRINDFLNAQAVAKERAAAQAQAEAASRRVRNQEVLKPNEVIPPTVRGPGYGPHFSESRPVIETTGRMLDPLEAEFRRRDAARAQREQIQSQLRAQTEAQVKSIPASTTKTTTDIVAAQRDYIAGVRRATKAHEAEARSVLPSGSKPTATWQGSGRGNAEAEREYVKAMERASAGTLFHGTNASLKSGDVILPHSSLGIKTELGSNGMAWAAIDQQVAQLYATMRTRGYGGKERIYQVEPLSVSEIRRNPDDFTLVGSKEGFRVVEEAPFRDYSDPNPGRASRERQKKLAKQRQDRQFQLDYERDPRLREVLDRLEGAVGFGGAGIPPRKPPTNALGGGNWEDEFRRREIARQQREQMRRRLDAEAARTLRPVSETEMNAYKWRQGVIANTPPGAERTRRLLSGSPVGPDTPAPKALRYVSEEEMNAYKWRQGVIDTVPPGALRTKYLLGKNGQAQFEADQAAARWRQNIMDIIPPGSTRTKYLLGKDPFNLGSLDLTKNSGSETPAARARFAADVGNFRRGLDVDWPFLDTGEGITRSEYAKSLRGNAKKGRLGSLDKELETAELLIDPTSALASIAEVKIRLAELRAQVTRPERLNFLETASASAKADQQYMLEGLDAADARANRIEARANRTISERALGAKSFEDLEDEDVYTPRKAAEDQVAAGRFHADTQKEIENDEELSASQMHSDVDAAEAKAHRQRLRDEEAIGRGRLDLVPLARRKQYAIGDEVTGALTDAESLKVAEARAKELSAAVRRSGLHDFRTPEGQTTLTGLLKEAEEARKFADSVAIPDGLSGERKLTAQRLIGEAAEELEFRKESPGPGSREDVAKAQKVRTTEEMGRRQGGVKALQDYHGVLKSEFSTLGMQTTELIRVGADTSGAKAKFRELLALLEKLEQEAATIDVKGLDSGSLKRLSQTREDIQKLRGGISPLGAQLFPQEPVTSPTYKDTRSGGRRFWDWMTTSDSRRGGGSGGSGGSGGGGGGGPIDPNDPFSFGSGEPPPKQLGRFSRVLARVRGAGGAASFFGTGALSTLRYGLPSMALYGAMGGISSGVREAQEFQFTMEKVKAQMEDTFGSGADPIFQSFKDNILDLSKTTGVQADVLASLGMQFQGAFSDQTIGNLSGQGLVKSQLDAAAKLSVATKIPAAELTDGLTAASFGFDKTNEEIGNIALRLESLSGVTAKETIGFIGDVAPVGKEAGFSAEEFAALAAVAQQKSGRSGTALAESFGRIIPAISQAKTQLLQLAAADDALRTPEFVKALSDGSTKDVLFAMLKNFKGLTKESQDFITNLLGGRREAQTLLSVVDSRGQIEEYTKGAKNSEGVLQARFESAQKTLTNQMQRLRQEFNLLVASLLEGGLGEVFSGLITTVGLFVRALEGILKISGGINDFFGGLPGKILGVVAAVKLLSLASAFTGKHLAIAVGANAATASGSSILPILAGKLAPTKLGGFMASRWAAGSAAAQGAGLGTFGRLFEGIRATRAAQATQAAQAAGMGSLGFLGQQAGAGTGAAAFGQQAAATGGAAAGARTLFAGGLTGLTAGAKGMATGVAGFLGISTAALGVGSVALAGLAVAYLAIRNGVNHQRKHAEEILKWASETDVSATELEALAKSRDSGPGNLARIGSFFTGERFLGDADIYRSVAFTKNISKDRLDAIGSLDSSAVNKALQDSLIRKPKFKKGTPEEAEASASARQDIREAQKEALANLANGDFQKGEFGKGSLAAQIFGRGTGITAVRTQLKTFTGLFGGNQTGKAEDALKKRIAKMAGVDDIKDVTEEVSKAFGGKNPYGDLQEIATSYSTKYTEDDKRQALSILEAAERDPEVIKASQKARTQLEVARKSQTLETITKNRDTGVISFSQYEEAATRNLNNMREMLREQKDPSDQTLQMFFSGLAEFQKAVSQKAMAFAQMSLADAELSGFDTPLDAATAKLETYTKLLKSGKVTDPESRRQLVTSVVQARKEAQLEMARKAGPEAAEAILSQQIEIDPRANVSNVIGTIGSVTGNWNRFSSQFKQATGGSAGAFIGGLVRGQQAGQLTSEQVIAQLEAKQKEMDAVRKNLERRGDTKRAKDLEGASTGIQDILDATAVNGGRLPGYLDPAKIEAAQARQIRDANAQAMGALAKARAGSDSVAGALADLAVARQMRTNAEGSSFAEETQAEARVVDAENNLKKILREKSKATMAVVKAQALARKDSVAAALADVAQADIDYKTAVETSGADSAEAKQAQANKITALAAIRDAQIAKAVDLMQLKKLNSKGDSVQDAVINLDIARFKANNAIGDEKPQALLDLQAAEKAARDSLISRYKALRELEKAKQNDPVAGANTDLQTAQTLLSAAQNEDEKIDAQRQLIEAERALQQAMSDVRDSKYDLRAAELAAMGDDVGSAQVQAQKARAQLQEALGLAAQGKGGGEAELNRLRAAVVSADKSASDAAFNDKLDDYKFMYEMGTLTKTEYVNYLEGLKSTLIPGTKQFKDLELTIKQLKDDISGGLQMNLPTSLALPTLYEVRRLNQSVGADGQAAGYNDNRVVTITLNINNGADQAEMINVLNQALGTGTSGRDPRLY